MAKTPANDTAAPGHNSGDLTEGQRKALFFHHLRKRMAFNADLDEIKADRKEAGKLAQADGLVLGDIDYAIKAIAADEKKTITDRFVAEGEILNWLGLSEGFQSDIFRDRAPAIDKIAKAGEIAGFAAKARESGYGPGSDEDTTWLNAYDAAQKQMLTDLEAAMLKKNAEKDELIKAGEPEPDENPFGDDEEGADPSSLAAAE
jgi:hypothetical protein